MNKKEIEQKLKDIPEDKYFYQRYEGRITKYKDDGKYYINRDIGLAFLKDDNLFFGKTSENLIDLIEEGDYVNGREIMEFDCEDGTVLGFPVYTSDGLFDTIECYVPLEQFDIVEILTHELYEANCYKVGGEEMSVKGKVKRLNKEILELQDELEAINLSNSRLRTKLYEQKTDTKYIRDLENIVKFALTNHIGNLRGGMQIDRYGIDKMQDLRLNIDYEPMMDSYVIRVNY